MPNAGRREKDLKCGSLPLNAGELAALLTRNCLETLIRRNMSKHVLKVDFSTGRRDSMLKIFTECLNLLEK